MSIIISDLSYHYANQLHLFENINMSVGLGAKISIVGDNGTGKSTLLQLIARKTVPKRGTVHTDSTPYYIPQQITCKRSSIGALLGVAEKLEALATISDGCVDPAYFDILADDWDMEYRCRMALDYWGLSSVDLYSDTASLSGGEKTKVMLAALLVHQPNIILLDEPTNHMDLAGRKKLYDYIQKSKATMIVVSHDISLLNLLDSTYELSSQGLQFYAGNYDFYKFHKEIERDALERQISSEQTTLRLARKKAGLVMERQNKRLNQGAKRKDQLPRILQKEAKDSGEFTAAKLKSQHKELVDQSSSKLKTLLYRRQSNEELKLDIKDTMLYEGKRLIVVSGVNFCYPESSLLWPSVIDLEIRSGERIHLTGDNGSGKTTFLKLLMGQLKPTLGEIYKKDYSCVYLDQDYSGVNTGETVLALAQQYNQCHLQEHEIKLRLNRLLFPKEVWDKSCNVLSGGERMRLYLCCLMIANQVPDIFILDEPTNNLDISSLSILTHTIKKYRGTLIVISHDLHFIHEIGITRVFEMKKKSLDM